MDFIYEKIWNMDMEKKSISVIFAQLWIFVLKETKLRFYQLKELIFLNSELLSLYL